MRGGGYAGADGLPHGIGGVGVEGKDYAGDGEGCREEGREAGEDGEAHFGLVGGESFWGVSREGRQWMGY